MYRWWFFLTVCIYGIVAFRIEEEFEDQDFWPKDQLASTFNDGHSKCMKDILLVVDTSLSIGETDFNDNVKPFLRNLVTNSRLNVGLHGTWIGLVIFSQKDKTKKILDVGEIKDPEELAIKIDSTLDYNEVIGDHTRTDKGLKIANEIFSQNNPQNNRNNIDDVVILITDGEPTGIDDVVTQTKKNAQDLKDKGILLIVAAAGPQRESFKPLMQELATSREMVLEADFDGLKIIMDELVGRFCTEPANKGFCNCAGGEALTRTIEPGKSTEVFQDDLTPPKLICEHGADKTKDKPKVKPQLPHTYSAGTHVVSFTFSLEKAKIKEITCPVNVEVKEFQGTCRCSGNALPITRTINSEESTVKVDVPFPQPTCVRGAEIISKTSEPQLPHKFPAGIHEIKYTFFLAKAKFSTITCPVKVKVKVKCGLEQYFPSKRSCCCGKTHKKGTGYKCCGQDYYNQNEKNCCGGVNLVSLEESC